MEASQGARHLVFVSFCCSFPYFAFKKEARYPTWKKMEKAFLPHSPMSRPEKKKKKEGNSLRCLVSFPAGQITAPAAKFFGKLNKTQSDNEIIGAL